jgi:2',3'-cyclic-nucleotide 2'-phosphodiesterase (5'-nucleotidase family)
MIGSIQGYSPSFKAAQLNILATSDNHGNFLTWPLLAQTVENNKKDIFQKAEEDSTLNLLAINGDWFINPSKNGFITDPDANSGKLQFSILNQFIDFVRKQAGKDAKFDTVYTMGNHDLDAGDSFMYNVMRKAKMNTLITNVDVENSPGIQKVLNKTDKVTKSKVYSIPDDKNPYLEHKVLLLGVTIPSMKFYNPGLLKDMRFFDDCNKKDANLKEEDLLNTFNAVKEEVEKFKEENPKGAVIVMSHTGAPISKMIKKHVPEIDVILNGHDHKNLTSLIGSTNIDSLGKDNEIIKAFSLKFDDDGDLEKEVNTYVSKATSTEKLDKNPINTHMRELLAEDLKPLVSVTDISGSEAELPYNELEVRSKNSYLANYLTSAVKRSVRKLTGENDVIVGIQSSIIRGGLKNGSNNLAIMKIFDGVSEDLSNVKIGALSGEELVGLITENIKSNLKNPKRNTLIQWSDIKINRTLISDIVEGKSKKDFSDAIQVRNNITNEFEPINLNKKYKIAIGEKFLVKDDIEWPGRIRDRFVSLDRTYDKLLRSYISSDEINYQLKVTPKTKENRIY